MRAALTTNTSASATCTTTKPLRVALRSRLAVEPRAPRVMGVPMCSACLSAVIEPNTSVDCERDGYRESEHGQIERDLLKARQVARADGNE